MSIKCNDDFMLQPEFLFLVESHSVLDNTAPVTDPSVEPVPLLSQSVTDTAISDITGTVDMMTT